MNSPRAGGDRPDELRRLADLVRYPKEELDVELKAWLDLTTPEGKADLAQALLALANHGGGWVIIGFDDAGQPAEPAPADMSAYSQDVVNGIVTKFAEPVFHCDVYLVSEGGRVHPVVSVPGSHRVPIRAKCSGPNEKHVRQHTYYLRLPGPQSAPVSTARDWDELISRCMLAARSELLERLHTMFTPGAMSSSPSGLEVLRTWHSSSLERFEELVASELPDETPSRYAHGHRSFSYVLELPSPVSLDALDRALRAARGYETGWPAWITMDSDDLRPYSYESTIECWLHRQGRDAAHSDFWRASPDGRLFLLRGYEEDAAEDPKVKLRPGEGIERGLHIWRVGECLLHVSRMAKALGVDDVNAHVLVQWSGLRGRRLGQYMTGWQEGPETAPARQDNARAELSAVASEIPEQLVELVEKATRPLYEAFSFRGTSRELIVMELDKMLKRSR